MTADRLNALAAEIHAANAHWWHDPATGERLDRNKGEMLMLVVSELSEAMEGERKDLMDDHLPHRKMAEVELADAKIRLFDFAGGCGYAFAEPSSYAGQDQLSDNRGEVLLTIVSDITDLRYFVEEEMTRAAASTLTSVMQIIDAYAAKFGYDVDGAMAEKREYNRTRQDHSNAARLAANGKKW